MLKRPAVFTGPRIVLVLCALIVAVVTTAATRSSFTKHDKAYYQSANTWFVPGVQVKILGASVAADGTIQAKFNVTDAKGGGLDIAGVQTPGAVQYGLVLSYIPAGQRQYVSYITTVAKAATNSNTATQATYDKGGVLTPGATLGQYTYVFKTKAPSGFDAGATHTMGIYVERDLSSLGDSSFYGIDDVFTFVPNGSPVTVVRDVINESSCNRCHDPMNGHGGSRTKMLMCVLCHTPQSTNPDTLNTVDMPVMIHKIHMGVNLPSVKAGGTYGIYHRGQFNDFSKVALPTGADPNNCQLCHAPGPKQADAWWQNPNRAACGACHDDINFASGKNHTTSNLPEPDDKQCATCHADTGNEFDASIRGAHLVPTLSKQLPGVVFNITNVTGAAGQSPVVTFTVKDKAGNPVDITKMSRLRLILGGPSFDYAISTIAEDATKATVASDGTATYTFTGKIPAGATGTFTVAIEGRNNVTLMPGTTKQQTVTDAGLDRQFFFSVDGSPVVPRRTVVATDNCNSCHFAIAVHGGSRNEVGQCVLCHNPNGLDSSKPAESIDFRTMIHKVHTGVNLLNGYHVGTTDFSKVGYPGDTRNCAKCHVNGSYNLPLADGLLAVQTPAGYTPTTPPASAACQGCHDDKSTASHALANTTALGESCVACHGPTSEFALDKVHAR